MVGMAPGATAPGAPQYLPLPDATRPMPQGVWVVLSNPDEAARQPAVTGLVSLNAPRTYADDVVDALSAHGGGDTRAALPGVSFSFRPKGGATHPPAPPLLVPRSSGAGVATCQSSMGSQRSSATSRTRSGSACAGSAAARTSPTQTQTASLRRRNRTASLE